MIDVLGGGSEGARERENTKGREGEEREGGREWRELKRKEVI